MSFIDNIGTTDFTIFFDYLEKGDLSKYDIASVLSALNNSEDIIDLYDIISLVPLKENVTNLLKNILIGFSKEKGNIILYEIFNNKTLTDKHKLLLLIIEEILKKNQLEYFKYPINTNINNPELYLYNGIQDIEYFKQISIIIKDKEPKEIKFKIIPNILFKLLITENININSDLAFLYLKAIRYCQNKLINDGVQWTVKNLMEYEFKKLGEIKNNYILSSFHTEWLINSYYHDFQRLEIITILNYFNLYPDYEIGKKILNLINLKQVGKELREIIIEFISLGGLIYTENIENLNYKIQKLNEKNISINKIEKKEEMEYFKLKESKEAEEILNNLFNK